MIVYVSLIYASREIEIILLFAGQFGNEAINFALKRWIREERPKGMHKEGYGMPSSHAQFMAFWSVYLTLFMLVRHQPGEKSNSWSRHWSNRLIISAASMLTAAAVSMSRIYLHYHTEKQVLVGIAAGTCTAVSYYIVTGWARSSGLVDYFLERPEIRWLRVRDLVIQEEIADAGWREWENKRANARKKKSKAAKKA
jgi:dolichyldiphosphatase